MFRKHLVEVIVGGVVAVLGAAALAWLKLDGPAPGEPAPKAGAPTGAATSGPAQPASGNPAPSTDAPGDGREHGHPGATGGRPAADESPSSTTTGGTRRPSPAWT